LKEQQQLAVLYNCVVGERLRSNWERIESHVTPATKEDPFAISSNWERIERIGFWHRGRGMKLHWAATGKELKAAPGASAARLASELAQQLGKN